AGRTTIDPSSNDGSRAAARASRLTTGSVETRPLVWISKSERAPPPVVPMSQGLKPLTEFCAATVIVLCDWGGEVLLGTPAPGVAGAGGPQPRRTKRTTQPMARVIPGMAAPPADVPSPLVGEGEGGGYVPPSQPFDQLRAGSSPARGEGAGSPVIVTRHAILSPNGRWTPPTCSLGGGEPAEDSA